MKLHSKWWFWLLLILIIYLILAYFEIVPIYQCGSTMGPNGPVNWCEWHKGIVVG